MALVSVNIPKGTEDKLNSVLDAAQRELAGASDTRRKLDAALDEHLRLAQALRRIADAFSGVIEKAKEGS